MEKTIKAPRLEPQRKGKMAALAKSVRKNWMLLLMVLPGVVWCAIFRYGPMYGALIAFQKYHVGDSILGGRWAGLYWFKKFFSHPQFKQLLTNTLSISILQLIFCFPVPVIFALLLNEVRNAKLKKLVQTVSYLPHFISLVAVCSMLSLLLNPGSGIVNRVLNAMGIESISWAAPSGIGQSTSYRRSGRPLATAPSSTCPPWRRCPRSCMNLPVWTEPPGSAR